MDGKALIVWLGLGLETMDMQGMRKAGRFSSEFRSKSFQWGVKFNVPTSRCRTYNSVQWVNFFLGY